MIEVLLFIEPIFTKLSGFFIVLFICSLIAMIMLYAAAETASEGIKARSKINRRLITMNKFRKLSIILAILVVVCIPLSHTKEGLINVYGYRAVTSDTAEKALEVVNSLLDKLSKYERGAK
jgi:hypothetical protein